MRIAYAFLAAPLALAACGDFAVPTPGTVFGSDSVAAKVAEFCAPEFVSEPTDAITEWLALFNALAPVFDIEPIDAGKYTEGDIATKFFAARAVICAAPIAD